MEKGSPEYYREFYGMVQEGICCGLMHPVEWITNYSRCLAIPYNEYPMRDKFVSLVAEDLYEIVHHKKPQENGVQQWIDKYYSKPL